MFAVLFPHRIESSSQLFVTWPTIAYLQYDYKDKNRINYSKCKIAHKNNKNQTAYPIIILITGIIKFTIFTSRWNLNRPLMLKNQKKKQRENGNVGNLKSKTEPNSRHTINIGITSNLQTSNKTDEHRINRITYIKRTHVLL